MGKCVDTQQDAFAEPTAQRLAGIGAGCFVQFNHNGQCDWVEITGTEKDQFVGVSHPELSQNDSENPATRTHEEMRLRKEQITALGCERYCFC